jgi:hypothetical protein
VRFNLMIITPYTSGDARPGYPVATDIVTGR